MKKILIVLMLTIAPLTMTSCAYFKKRVVETGKAMAIEKGRDSIKKAIPDKDKAEFVEKFDRSVREGLIFAGESIGADRLAAIIEKQDATSVAQAAENKRLADGLKEGGLDYAKLNWLAIAGALASGGFGIFGMKKGNKWLRLGRVLIDSVGALKRSDDDHKPLMKAISTTATAAGLKIELDKEVAKAPGA